MNSRNKGKRGEREWRDQLRQAGFHARRGQQYNGIEGEDVVSDDLPHFHCEVKRTERFNAYDALQQATDDADGKIPYVAHKRNRHRWIVVMWADDWLDRERELL